MILKISEGKRSTAGGWKDVVPAAQEMLLVKKGGGGGGRGRGLRAPAGLGDLFAGGRMPNPAALRGRGAAGAGGRGAGIGLARHGIQ